MEQPVAQKKRFFDRPVRLRTVLRIVGILIFVCAVVWGVGKWQLLTTRAQAREAVRNEIRSKGEALGETIAVTSRDDIRNSNFDKVQDYFSDLVKQPDIQYLIVMKLSGEAVVHTDAKFRGKKLDDSLAQKALQADELTVSDLKDKKIYEIAIPVMGYTGRAAIVRIGVSYSRAETAFRT